jgi:hypothetical protein
LYPAADHQCRTATAGPAIARLAEIDLAGPGAAPAAFTRARPEASGREVLPDK